MRTLIIDCLSVFGLMIAYNTVIAVEGVRMENDVFRDTMDTYDDDIADSDNEAVCARVDANLNPCPCQCLNSSLIYCNLDSPSSGLCDSYSFPATEIKLLNSHLHSIVINRQFILSLGWQQSSLWALRLRNCSISDTTFGTDLDGLRVLDLRGNNVEAFKEPEIEKLQSIYLSGSFCVCLSVHVDQLFV